MQTTNCAASSPPDASLPAACPRTSSMNGEEDREIARVHCVGYRRIITLETPVTATQVRVTVTKSRQGFYLADAYAVRA